MSYPSAGLWKAWIKNKGLAHTAIWRENPQYSHASVSQIPFIHRIFQIQQNGTSLTLKYLVRSIAGRTTNITII